MKRIVRSISTKKTLHLLYKEKTVLYRINIAQDFGTGALRTGVPDLLRRRGGRVVRGNLDEFVTCS